jgi:hypothetical protein
MELKNDDNSYLEAMVELSEKQDIPLVDISIAVNRNRSFKNILRNECIANKLILGE